MTTAFFAFFIDACIGDPRSRLHPVVLMGNFISLMEKLFYRAADSDNTKLLKGYLVVIIVLLLWWNVGYAIDMLAKRVPYEWFRPLVDALLLSFMISPHSLAEAGKELYNLLAVGNLEEARRKVGWIVGRDTDKLDPPEITRATVETIAENTIDGVISPLFFFAIGGLPFAVLYRAANTMDSMLGYKNDKYLYFGRCAAKLDDVLNYIPARITGIFIVLSAALLKFDYRNALAVMKRDAKKHPSPNGGYAEATVAGALHIRLGGYNSYFGKMSFREYMGDPWEQLSERHILETIRIMYTATVLFLIAAYVMERIMGYR